MIEVLKKLIRILNSVTNRFGFYVIPRSKSHEFMLIKRMQRIIDEYKIDCIIDVGANSGQYYNFLRNDINFKGMVISFEPDPDNYQIIYKNSQNDPLWIVEQCALGEEESKLEFNIMESSVFNSFLKPDDSETNIYNTNCIKKIIEVSVKRLDSLFIDYKEKYNIENVFLKLDTQGFDLKVFRGSVNMIDHIKGVQTEVSFMPLYRDAPTFSESLELFRKYGFNVSGLYSLGEDRFPYAIEYDCIFLPMNSN